MTLGGSIARLDASKRSLKDKIIALDLDEPAGDSFSHRVVKPRGYGGINGDGRLSVVAITGVDHPDHIDLYLNNNRPSIDVASGELLDNEKVGANSTIELFRVSKSSPALNAEHVKTFIDPQIATPNRVAPTGSGPFYFTNDHGTNKVGLWHELSPILKNGDVSFCTAEGACKRVDSGFAFPNGLHFGRKDKLLYVPSTISGQIVVYKPDLDYGVKKVDILKTGYPLDNISEDENGDYWVAALSQLDKALGTFDDPLGDAKVGATILRVRKNVGKKGYQITKMLEDPEGEVLPVATAVVHDVKTGRLFISGVVAPFIAVCDPKAIPAEGS